MKIRKHLPGCEFTSAPLGTCGCLEKMLDSAEARVAELEEEVEQDRLARAEEDEDRDDPLEHPRRILESVKDRMDEHAYQELASALHP